MSYYYFYILVPIVTALIHIGIAKRPMAKGRGLEIWLQHLIFWGIGIGGILCFLAVEFDFWFDWVREAGWEGGSTFRTIAGYFFLALGVCGVIAPFLRGGFWLATTIMGVFMGVVLALLLIIDGAAADVWAYAIVYGFVGSAVLLLLHAAYLIRVGWGCFFGCGGLSCHKPKPLSGK